jgi:hypothetical protein
MKVERKLALALLGTSPSIVDILKIMVDSGHDSEVCLAGIKLLKDKGYGPEDFWKLIEISGNKESVFKPCAAYLDLSTKRNTKILNLLKKTGYHWSIAIPAAAALKIDELSEKEIIEFMDKACREEVYTACCPFIDLEKKTEAEIWALLAELHFNWLAKYWIAPYLKSPENLLELAKKANSDSDDDKRVRLTCFQALGVAGKTDDELIQFVKDSGYNSYFCQEAIKFFKLDKYVIWLVSIANYNQPICEAAIERLDDEELIMLIVEKTTYSRTICQSALPKLKSEDNIMAIWAKCRFEQKIGHLAISSIPLQDKTEDELADLIKKYEFGQETRISTACQPFLALDKKSDDEMIDFLAKTDYNNGACRLFLPILKLTEKTEEEIFRLLKKSRLHENVGKVLIDYITSEENILKIAKENYHTTDFWIESFRSVLSSKNDEELMLILKDFHYEKKICVMVIQLIKETGNIISIIENSGYNEEVARIGLNLLNKKEGHKLNVHLIAE